MNSSEKNYHYKQLIQLKAGVGNRTIEIARSRSRMTGLPTPQPWVHSTCLQLYTNTIFYIKWAISVSKFRRIGLRGRNMVTSIIH